MSDADDFEFDDFGLDADALAQLDAAERQQLSAVEAEPPTKRPRIKDIQTPKPPRTSNAVRENVELPDDMELPELPVQDISSATFSFNVHRRALMIANATPAPAPSPAPQLAVAPGSSSRGRGYILPNRPNVPSRGASQYRPQFNKNTSTSTSTVPPARATASTTTHQSPRIQQTTLAANEGPDERDHRLLELENLLKAETSKRMSRDGEITMLRRNLERAAQGSAASLAAAREEKESAEAKVLKMKKEMQEEMERLKTQYIFKQQEIGTSSRKPPISARPSRLSKEPSFPGWNTSPSVSRIGITQEHRWQSTPRPTKVPDSPEKSRKSAALPGFQNAFTEATPWQQQSTARNATISPRKSLMDKLKESTTISPPVSPTATEVGNEDVAMEPYDNMEIGEVILSGQSTNDNDDISLEDSDELESFSTDYPNELARIIISYTGAGSSPLLQLLIEVSHDPKLPVNYPQSVAALLQILGELPLHGYPQCVPHLCKTLSTIFEQLAHAAMMPHMTSLLDAFTTMAAEIPGCKASLLSIRVNDQPLVFSTLSNVLALHIENLDISPEYKAFGVQAFTFLREMCWNITEDIVEQLGFSAKQHGLFASLCEKSRPVWILNEGIRFLEILASHHAICVHLLPSAEKVSGDPDNYLNGLSRLLIDLEDDSTTIEVKESILHFFAELALSSPEALRKLTGPSRLLPSLVFYIYQLVTPLWEADAILISNPLRISESLRMLGDTVLLLYHLVTEGEESFDLRQCLYQAPHRPFNGIAHMFTVSFARLSYADPPSCLNEHQKHSVEALSDLARELLDLVVDGPESETVWNAFQDEPEDPGEMEEHLLGPDTDGLGG